MFFFNIKQFALSGTIRIQLNVYKYAVSNDNLNVFFILFKLGR